MLVITNKKEIVKRTTLYHTEVLKYDYALHDLILMLHSLLEMFRAIYKAKY